MGCKYCNLKHRKDDGVEWIAGEDWESESDDGGYICPHGDGFRMLVYYDARCACTAVDNIKYCPFCGAELTMPTEPLIKDEKIRKAVKAWADANDYSNDEIYEFEDFSTGWKSWSLEHKGNGDDNEIHFNGGIDFDKMNHQGYYTIAELCGEGE